MHVTSLHVVNNGVRCNVHDKTPFSIVNYVLCIKTIECGKKRGPQIGSHKKTLATMVKRPRLLQ